MPEAFAVQGSDFILRFQDGCDLVLDHFLDRLTARLEVGPGIEIGGVTEEAFPDGAGHGKADIGVDIDLAYRHVSGFVQHIFRHALGALYAAAEFIAFLHEFLQVS